MTTVQLDKLDGELRSQNDAALLNHVLCILAQPLTPVNNMLLCAIEDELQRRQQERVNAV